MNHLAHILRDWDAFLVRLSRVDESSQSGTSFPESGTSFEDVITHHVVHVLREWNVGLESERLQLTRSEVVMAQPPKERTRLSALDPHYCKHPKLIPMEAQLFKTGDMNGRRWAFSAGCSS